MIVNSVDDKLASALALAIVRRPRATLQEIAKSAGISKATLYRIAPTRKAVIEMLLERATGHLQDALAKAELDTSPSIAALSRLTANVVKGRAFYLFWYHAQWVRVMDDKGDPSQLYHSFFSDALEKFFLRGQEAGVFRIDLPARWLAMAYDSLLFSAIDSAEAGRVAPLGLESLVEKTLLAGIVAQSLPADVERSRIAPR
ncbi:TetR/AcrR family transcriptional regulator [Ectothiorhodospira shaposhnikovii]|uniref:TetR/AcrR family transcriptional regulator n=1 Tax=Ectothiorhodospira shaposhnikovii TaxID=1054 RepID=UPI001902E253|nr:TetR/AcrR family transcriptional regulator [Ectothiorhodospira shaposhnikovii]